MTYARARLYIGITGVGTVVTLCFFGIIYSWPERFFTGEEVGLLRTASELALFFFTAALLLTPFDYLGGYLLPNKFERVEYSFSEFLPRWGRAALIHTGFLVFFSLSLITAARISSPLTAILLLPILFFVLTGFQKVVASLLSPLTLSSSERIEPGAPTLKFTEEEKETFTGGIVGIPGFETILLPAAWKTQLSSEELDAVIARKRETVRSGARTRGVYIAVAFNLLGFCLALLPEHSSLLTTAGLVNTYLWFTLWSFLGLLSLPWVSRKGVYLIDKLSLSKGVDPELLTSSADKLEALQDGEPERSDSVESVFHPIPAVANRKKAIEGEYVNVPEQSGWNVARMALYLSWATGGLLSRAVHCNSGRPHLWVLLPTD